MIRFLIVGVFLISFEALHAQTPNYFDNNPEWRLRLGYSGFITPYDCPAYEDIVYYLNGDSIISNITYKKLLKKDWWRSGIWKNQILGVIQFSI